MATTTIELDKSISGNVPLSRLSRAGRLIDWRPICVLASLIAGISVIDMVWLAIGPMSLDIGSMLHVFRAPLVCAVISVIYIFFRPAPRIAMTLLAIIEMALFTAVGAILSYLTMATGWPMADHLFAQWDAALGFDWVAYVAFIREHHWLYVSMKWLYQTSIPQVLLLALVLGFSGHFNHLNRLMANLIISAVAIVIIGAMLPGLGAYHYYGIPPHGLAGFVAAIQAVHDGTQRLIDFNNMEGLIAFPSYHTAMSVAFILAAWPLRYLRYPMLLGNLLLIAGVPVIGSHYLVDIIAGAGVVVAIDLLWRRAERRWARLDREAGLQRSFAN